MVRGLWTNTLLPGSCGHREPSPRPEAILPPSIPMVLMPRVGLRDEEVALPKQDCSSLAHGSAQRGNAAGHRCATRDGSQAGCEQLPPVNQGCSSGACSDTEEQ